jgi:deazaflavin-dependent oxidoreductase (nitroreductase family)
LVAVAGLRPLLHASAEEFPMSEESKPESPAPASGYIPPLWAMKLMTRTHVFLSRLSGGKLFNSIKGDDVCFISMTGAKSGRAITIPLMYVPYQDGVLLVASKGGAPTNPVWYNNLVKHPDIEVRHRGRLMVLRARLAASAEKDALWPICDDCYADYADYRQKTDRDIPIFVCEPTG